jgi:hypothetical protein
MTLTPNTKAHEAAYVMQIWSYGYAPIEYRELFDVPDPEHVAYIVYQRRVVDNWNLAWVAPNGTWWALFYDEQIHDIDEYTAVYLLTDKLKR